MGSVIDEIGIVRDTVEGMVVVGIEQNSRCQACGMCSNIDGRERRLTAYTDETFQVGERIQVCIEGKNLLLAAFIIYMVPLLDMFIGYFAGYYLTRKFWNPDMSSMIAGLSGGIFFVLSFLFSRQLNKKWERNNKTMITLKRIE